MNKLTLLLLIIFQSSFGQNIESKIKILCGCKPISFYPVIDKKLVFTKLNEGEYLDNLYMYVYEKIGNRYTEAFNYLIDDETDRYDIVLTKNNIEIGNKEYFYSIYALLNTGTAYNGREKYMFVFKDLNNSNEPIIIYFEKWINGNGEYYVKGNKEISPYKLFLNKCSEFIDKEFPVKNDNIDDIDNFHLKWDIENSKLFNSINNEETDIQINFIKYKDKTLYDNYIDENNLNEVKSSNYLALGGFTSPIVLYDILNKESKVIFIPEGWPNGGGWGFRSYHVKNIKDNILEIESDVHIIKINLDKSVLNVFNK
jgi:hypothetical protein